MATTFVDYTGDGNATKSFSFPSIKEADVKVKVDDVLKTASTHYNITSYTTTGGGNVVFTSGNIPASPAAIRIYRDTDVDTAKATYTAGSSVKAGDLNNNNEQLLFAAQEEQNIVNATTTVSGFMSKADKTKLDGVETAATADQTAAEIRTLVESASDSNVFTDADHTKLNSVESGATADQTNAEIKTAYEANSNTNAFTDAEKTKLSGIEASATADQTNSEIKTAYEANSNTNAFTDAEKTKLSGVEASATADQTNAEIKTAYEANSDTNAFTDAEKTKLSGVAAGAEVNVQADFNASSGDALILNKPSIPSGLNDLTDVDTTGVADNKILKYQASSSKFVIADDTGGGGGSSTFTGLSDSPTNYTGAAGKTLKVNSSGNAIEFVDQISDVVGDTTPQLGGNLDVQAREINTSTTNGNIKLNPNGTGVIEIKGSGTGGTLQLNCEANSHGIKLKSPPHSAAASYTLTFPNNVVNGQFLKTDASGNLSWAAVDLTALSASNLTSGTIPDARFPATLPAVSGANLTNLPASSYNISINTLSSSSGTGGGSATFNGTATRFTLSNAGPNAQAHIVSVNGVIQKPNSGTSPSEGFAIDGNDIIFASAPANGADFFILTIGTAVTIGTPSDGTVSEAKLNVSNSPTNGYFLSAQSGNSGGLTWAQVADTSAAGASGAIQINDGSNAFTAVNTHKITGDSLFTHDLYLDRDSSNGDPVVQPGSGATVTYKTSSSASGAFGSILDGTGLQLGRNTQYVKIVAPADVSGQTSYTLTLPHISGNNGQVLTTNGSGTTSWEDGASTVAGGAIYENSQTISASHTIPVGSNGMSAGPVTVNNGITLTISSGSTYTIV